LYQFGTCGASLVGTRIPIGNAAVGAEHQCAAEGRGSGSWPRETDQLPRLLEVRPQGLLVADGGWLPRLGFFCLGRAESIVRREPLPRTGAPCRLPAAGAPGFSVGRGQPGNAGACWSLTWWSCGHSRGTACQAVGRPRWLAPSPLRASAGPPGC